MSAHRSLAARLAACLLAVAACLPRLPGAIIAPDPFAGASAPVAAPEILENIETMESGEGAARIAVTRLTFRSRGENTVYAVYARQPTRGRRPAILFLHGGGSGAEEKLGVLQHYARQGYVALACDLPGICGPAKAPRSTGPWRSAGGGEAARFEVSAGSIQSVLVDAGTAALDAFRLLRSLPEVDPERMGVTGKSWGGYSATFVAGLLGDQVKAAYSVWGSGYYDRGSFWLPSLQRLPADARDTWLAWLDAGRRAPGITAPFFIEGATNDTYFWPPAVDATLAAVPGAKNRVWWPNLHHAIPADAAPTRQLFFDYHLKGFGRPFGTVAIEETQRQPDGALRILARASLPAGVELASVKIWHSETAPTWKKRVWQAADATRVTGQTYAALLPADVASRGVDFYAHLTDTRRVSVSSAVASLPVQSAEPKR